VVLVVLVVVLEVAGETEVGLRTSAGWTAMAFSASSASR